MSSDGETKLERAILPTCAAAGVELIDVEFRSGTVVVTVQNEEEGVDLDRIAELSRAVSTLLDADDRLGPSGHYELEVTSPGLEQRLRRPAHFQRIVGRLIAIRTVAGTPGERRLTGEIVAADDAGIEIKTADTEQTRRVHYDEIERAHTVVDWQAELREGKTRAKREKVTMS